MVDVAGLALERVGGGSSSPSLAFRASCRAKSLACHHSRNLSAKMLVGRRTRRLDRRRAHAVAARIFGFASAFSSAEAPDAPSDAGLWRAASATAAARISAALTRRTRVLTSQRRGWWKRERSKR